MKPNCRMLQKVKRLSDGKEFLGDSFALWEDLGSGYLQPTVSMQTNPMFRIPLKNGQGYNGFVFVDIAAKPYNTSMNCYCLK